MITIKLTESEARNLLWHTLERARLCPNQRTRKMLLAISDKMDKQIELQKGEMR